MEKVIYKTLAECEAAIKTLIAIGVGIPDWGKFSIEVQKSEGVQA